MATRRERRTMARAAAVGWIASGLWASAAQAQSIPIANADFEIPNLAANAFTVGNAPGWTALAGGTSFGVFYPTIASWGYVAPSNEQVLYLNGVAVEQILAASPEAGVTYLLSLDVVNRPSFFTQDYSVELWAGSELLAWDDGSLAPAVGQSERLLLTVSLSPGDPAIGQSFRIRLGGATQTNFDDVRLVPEPERTRGCGAAVLFSVLARKRMRRRLESGEKREAR